MRPKKTETKFTIQFSQDDLSHVQVADILNKLGRFRKAQYIVDAVMHYISYDVMQGAKHLMQRDEKVIEDVVSRLLREKDKSGTGLYVDNYPATQTPKLQSCSKPDLEEATSSLGEDEIGAVADMLDMFRRK